MVPLHHRCPGADEDGCECRQHQPVAAAAWPLLLPASVPPGGEEVVSVTGCVQAHATLLVVCERMQCAVTRMPVDWTEQVCFQLAWRLGAIVSSSQLVFCTYTCYINDHRTPHSCSTVEESALMSVQAVVVHLLSWPFNVFSFSAMLPTSCPLHVCLLPPTRWLL